MTTNWVSHFDPNSFPNAIVPGHIQNNGLHNKKLVLFNVAPTADPKMTDDDASIIQEIATCSSETATLSFILQPFQ